MIFTGGRIRGYDVLCGLAADDWRSRSYDSRAGLDVTIGANVGRHALSRRKGRGGPPDSALRRRGTAVATESGPTRHAILWRAAVIVIAGFLTYGNTLNAPYLFDDQNSILNNQSIRDVWPLSVPLSPPRDTPVAGRPIVNLTFAVNYALHGLDLEGYHLVNIAIHLLAALTLFGLIRRTLLLPRLVDRFGGASTNLAWACALIWMLHPLQTESVNYLSERTESLMGLFYFLTLYCAVRGGSGKGEGGRGREEERSTRWNVGAVVACAIGMACKESMVTAPLIVVLYDRMFVFDSLKAAFRARRELYGGLAASWIVLAALLSSTPRTSAGFGSGTTPWVYLLNQVELILRYLWLTVWPRALVLDYGLPQPFALSDVLPQAASVVVLGLAVLVALWRWPALGFLGAWFFITLGPTSSIVPISTEVGAERRMYLPLAGLVVLAAVAVGRVFTARQMAGRKDPPHMAWAITVVVCALLATGTFLRNREYQSRLLISQTIVDRWPSGRGHFILGVELLRVERQSDGMAELRASAPDYPGARYAIGTELFGQGMLDAAIVELRAFVQALPTHVNATAAHDQLGRAYLIQGRVNEALQEFNYVLAQPDYPLRAEVMSFVEQVMAAQGGRRPN